MRHLRDYGGQIAQRGVEINVLPLIDCMLFLLIFFISTTVFEEATGVEVQKPQAASAARQRGISDACWWVTTTTVRPRSAGIVVRTRVGRRHVVP